MHVLLEFARQPGEVLNKEQLIEAVWPKTFVSEYVLTRCISLLRKEMQDDPQNARYIQTIPKVGYRLVAEVRLPEGKEKIEVPTSQPDLAASRMAPQESLRLLQRLRLWQIASAVVLMAALTCGAVLWRIHARPAPPAFRVVSLTSYAGLQDQARFSPDGNRVAFAWSNLDEGNRNLYIKQIGSETLLRLTHGAELDFSPVWSPEGSQIAYLSSSGKGLGIYTIPSLGGVPQKLYTPLGMVHWEQGDLSWSPDGKSLVFSDGASGHTPALLYLLSLDSLQARVITAPPHEWEGDFSPVFSPDGRWVAFVRAIEGAVRDIYMMPAGGGVIRQVTHDRRIVDSLTWAADGKSILFSSDRGGKYALWKVALRGGEPERLPVGAEDAFSPAVAGNTHRLVYTESSATWSIRSFPLLLRGVAGKSTVLVSSTQQDSAPSLAPDGSRFAFQSWRSGTQELWIASRDGLSLRQLTTGGRGLTGSPSFSPDGQQVAFDSRPEGHSHIFVVSASGGSPRQLTVGDWNDILPRWSVDGQSIYFASNRSGTWQSWKIGLGGGSPRQVTVNGGNLAMESPDGRWIYYTKSDSAGIWRIPMNGGAETLVYPQPQAGYWGYWAVTVRGLYLLDLEGATARIVLYDPEAKKITPIASLERRPPPYSGISISRNEDQLLITDEINAGSHITLVENIP